MEIRTTYVCNGAIYCGFKPENVEVKEEHKVLYPAKGYELVRKSDGEKHTSVLLKDGDVEDNYIEIKIKEKEQIKENIKESKQNNV